ncbi:MAG: FtsH protease activity modulator HflK [Oscillospiraceae bacterium]|nr:FtsH protease activity modulator HflK [Oscillospiraceae bacterium]
MNYNENPFGRANKPINPKKIRNTAILIILIIFVIALVSTCWYTIDDKQQGVVTTFGKVTSRVDSGIHFKLPFGIQQVHKVDVNVYQKIEIGYRTNFRDSASYETIDNESKMITGDFNIVNVDFFVEYKINDPVKYLYNSMQPEAVLKNLVQSQIRNVIGSSEVEMILTTGKAAIQSRVKELVIEVLDTYDIGLSLTDIRIQDSEPPTVDVMNAFKAVETAKQGADTVINQAKAYENAQLPLARANADKQIQNAEYVKQHRINEAKQQVAMFNAMYIEYALNPDITKIRMYYEMLQAALPGVKLYIDVSNDGSSTQLLLPLESFISNSQSNGNY